MNETEGRIIDRIDEYLNAKGMKSNKMEAMCGLSAGLLSKARAGLTDIGASSINKILGQCKDMSRVWLITGEGSMLSDNEQKANFIPLINIDSVGGMESTNDVTDTAQYVERLVEFDNAQPGDIAMNQSGKSMLPTIPPGSIMQLRKVMEWQHYLSYGDIYVVELTDGRRITKEIRKYAEDPENYVLCVSHNDEFDEQPLPRAMIRSVWKVVSILTKIGW